MPLAARPREPSNRLLLGLQRATRRRRSGRLARVRAGLVVLPAADVDRLVARSFLVDCLLRAIGLAVARSLAVLLAHLSLLVERNVRGRRPAPSQRRSRQLASLPPPISSSSVPPPTPPSEPPPLPPSSSVPPARPPSSLAPPWPSCSRFDIT